MLLGMEVQRTIATVVAFGQTSCNSSRSSTAQSGEWHHQHRCMAAIGKAFQIKSTITSNFVVDTFGHGMHTAINFRIFCFSICCLET
jgi:hypothetical protein